MGSNYQLSHEEMRQVLRDTLRVERGSILEPIRAIEVRPFFGKSGDTSLISWKRDQSMNVAKFGVRK
jgi:hypothetical protein